MSIVYYIIVLSYYYIYIVAVRSDTTYKINIIEDLVPQDKAVKAAHKACATVFHALTNFTMDSTIVIDDAADAAPLGRVLQAQVLRPAPCQLGC